MIDANAAAIALPFDPIAVRAVPVVLTWHGLLSAAGILAALYFAGRLAPAAGLYPDGVWRAAGWVVLGGLAGARLLFAAEHPAPFLVAPLRLLLVTEGGISVFGAVLGGMAAGGAAARRAGVSARRLLEAAAPGFLLGQAVGRVGDVVNGEHLGMHALGLPWAVVYTHPETLGEIGVPVHPAVAYELVWDLAAAGAAAWLLTRRHPPPGATLWVGLLVYRLGRWWVGFFRLDPDVLLGLGLAQLLGLAMAPLALIGLVLALRRGPRARV